MNYITSCPKCDTHFLLNDELIKAHRGKVQCGSCEHVFNAKNRLTEVADDITDADEYQASLEDNQETVDETVNISAQVTNITENESAITEDNYIGTFSPSTLTTSDVEHTLDLEHVNPIDDFTKRLNSAKNTKKYTALLGLLSLLLIFAATAQAIYHLRVKIAAEHPQFKPLLVNACAHLNCTVDLPKELDLITIGDSDMQEDDNFKSVINFSSSLKNNANYPQAYPNIELTLTNADDQIAIKKLITPKDYLSADKKIEDGLPAHEVNPIKLALYVNEATVAGYRILLVY
jgi:predicted Zn finger-like uncharacterized protein